MLFTKEDLKELIDFLEENIPRLINNEADEINFSGTDITPNKLHDALEYLGYEFVSDEINGWQCDCWWQYEGHPAFPPITMFFSGFEFILKLLLTDLEEE